MSKGYDLKNSASDLEKKEVNKQDTRNLNEFPESCINCHSQDIEYWDETDEEIIFQCKVCKKFITIPFRRNKLRFYFI